MTAAPTAPRTSAFLLVLSGLYGAAGVAAMAAATHMGGDNLRIAGTFLLFHTGPLLALGTLAQPTRLSLLASLALALGVALFSGDLIVRSLASTPLFPMAAPIGGMILILGWLLIAAFGVAKLSTLRKP